jgi:archaeosine-15-forming tRNA-guanine transglycosylase
MLSTEQKKLRDIEAKSNSATAESLDASYKVRVLSSKYDEDRVAELWANLTMIQQMQSKDVWLSKSQESGLSWNEYISRLVKSRGARVLVFENSEEIFGFAYLVLESKNSNNPMQKTSLKAVIKELYLEPAYRKESKKIEMAELMQTCLMKMNIEYIEFDIKDLF